MIWTLLRRIFCRHKRLRFDQNVYGDLINYISGKRSLWICERCGCTVAHGLLYHGKRTSLTKEELDATLDV